MIKYYSALAISIIFNCSSLILLKKGMISEPSFSENMSKMSSWFNLMTNSYILLGFLFFAISFVTWMISLVKIDLSLAYPTVSITYVIIAVSAHYLFNESITLNRWLGISVIIIGIIIMYKK